MIEFLFVTITQDLLTLAKNISVIFLLVILSIAFRYVMIKAGQLWIRSFAHSITLAALPIITFSITKVISGNIALSLGMVGALSIVRFRNPVRSPLELTVYFACITSGIIAAANPIWLAVLVCGLIVMGITFKIMQHFSIKLGYGPIFYSSFSEGNEKRVLEMRLADERDLELLDLSVGNLIYKSKSADGYSVALAFDQVEDANFALHQIQSKFDVIEYSIK